MDHGKKRIVVGGFIVAGGIVAALVDIWSRRGQMSYSGGLNWAASLGLTVSIMGSAVCGALLGAVVGFLVALCLPNERTTCIKCGSANAVQGGKSPFSGKMSPNKCRDCGYSW